jgi:superfamily II DNA/RNA helicase
MFDPITAALMRSAPQLEGLDLEGLPRRLTEAFASVVSARIRLRSAVPEADSSGLAAGMSELRRLAATYEAYVALLPDRQDRAAAAFVAASAHQAVMLGGRIVEPTSRISAAALSPEVCSTLLFLVAEASADAAEAAKRIRPDEEASLLERALLESLRNLAQGRLIEIIRRRIPEVEVADVAEGALQALYSLLLTGVINLAKQLRSRIDLAVEEGGIEPARSIFLKVKDLCVDVMDDVLGDSGQLFSVYPGPLHLANLLLAVERDLLETSLSRIPAPGGLKEGGWWQVVRRLARRRPYLWRNHREAIGSGYLEQGKSAAISFPTGGGKSTLAELKIATALLRSQKVVFLVPTHALVGQTTRSLKSTFRDYDILGDVDDDITVADEVALPEVIVTTPERCLMILAVQPEAFADLGLIVFDECHLLHPRDDDRSRRALDAMLVVLNLTSLAPNADLLLLSAMMKNTQEIAEWIGELTGRACLSLDLAWKPTRQVRGCVVYPADEVVALRAKLTEAREQRPGQRTAPAHIKRELLARPFGLFGLLQTWSTTERQDYALLPLLEAPQLLSSGTARGGRWYLTPNGNETSGAIAAASVAAGMKTLTFVQTTVFCESCVKSFRDRLPERAVLLNAEEKEWRRRLEEEMGGGQYCYLQIDSDGLLRAGAASHHGLLLREERELHESLFRRPDGISALFATSTLAQGMNLPSEVVIISGDSRFDPGADKMQQLEAHELLNAAGRAGRAGEGSQGFVLLVPSRVIDFDDKESRINGHWMELQAIFEQADQCLVIDDPMEGVLDQIHAGAVSVGMPAYLLSRLPVRQGDPSEDPAEVLLKKSLGAFRARKSGNEDWINSRVAAAINARAQSDPVDQPEWIDRVAGSTGVPLEVLRELSETFRDGAFAGSTLSAINVILELFVRKPELLMSSLRPESLEGLFGEAYKNLPSDSDRALMALGAIKLLLPQWMSGLPLCDLEATFLGRANKLGKCEHARHFVTRIVPEIAFLASLPARLELARNGSDDNAAPTLTVIATLGAAVREGCDSPEALATRVNAGREFSRVAARRLHDRIVAWVPIGEAHESFERTRARMDQALDASFAAG